MIKILLEKGTNKATLEIPGEYTHPIVVGALIQSCISFVENGGKLEIPNEKSQNPMNVAIPTVSTKNKNMNNNPPGRPRQVPMIGQRNEMPLIRDAFEKAGFIFKGDLVDAEKDPVKEEHKIEKPIQEKVPEVKKSYPSLKEKNGKKLYQCYYWFKNPDCSNRGKHYIPLDRKTVSCHRCGALHIVRSSSGEIDQHGVPKQDKFGNYFLADRLAIDESKKANESEGKSKETNDLSKSLWSFKVARKTFVCENSGCNNDVPKGVGYYQKGKGKRVCSICNDKKAN